MRGVIPPEVISNILGEERVVTLYRICVYVDDALSTEERGRVSSNVPRSTDSGLGVDVSFVPRFELNSYRGRERPVRGGTSIGSTSDPYAGTLGGVVRDLNTSGEFIMTCGHVVQTITTMAQPGMPDGGKPADAVAGPAIDLETPSHTRFGFADPYHRIDAAIANLTVPTTRSFAAWGAPCARFAAEHRAPLATSSCSSARRAMTWSVCCPSLWLA